TKEEIRSIFDKWNDALSTGDPNISSSLSLSSLSSSISPPLLLLPTMSNEPRTNRKSIERYFVNFLRNKPKGRIINGHIRIGKDGSWAHDAGIYEFSMISNSNNNIARYSFLYLRNDLGEWKIAHHHSSLMPE
ncbi:hypothetical protein FRACYDRAFT_154683, partial [Fragilariopsis cylindrus CCMP1102]